MTRITPRRQDGGGTPATSPAVATDPHWFKLGLAVILGTVAGTMLFATRAEGRAPERR